MEQRFRIKELMLEKSKREQRTIRQKDVAQATGIKQNVISQIANGVIQNPRIEHLEALADYFGVSIDELIGREESSKSGHEFIYSEPNVSDFFENPIYNQVVSQSLSESQRQTYHQQIFEKLTALGASQTPPEVLAHHATEAGLNEPAAEYWQLAGEKAIQRGESQKAIRFLEEGLKSLDCLPHTSEQPLKELKLQLALGIALTITEGFGYEKVGRAYTRARELWEQIKTREIPATKKDDVRPLFLAVRGLWQFYLVKGDLQTAQELGEQLTRLARDEGDPALLAASHEVLGTTLYKQGELTLGRGHLEEAAALYDSRLRLHRPSSIFLFGQDLGVTCRSILGYVMGYLGYPDQSLHLIQEARSLASQLSHPFSLAMATFFSILTHYLRREGQVVKKLSEELISLSIEHGFSFWLALGTTFKGWALASQGQCEAGISQLQAGFKAWETTGAREGLTHALMVSAEAYGKCGQTEKGIKELENALEVGAESGERWCEAEIYRLKGELLLTQGGEAAEGETCFRQAIEIAKSQRAKFSELRATLSLSRLWQKQGKKAEARQLLAGIYNGFTEGFETADLREAKALLEELS